MRISPFDTAEPTTGDDQLFTPDELYTEKEAAERFKMSHHTLRGNRCRGEGPKFVRIGSAVRYWGRDLNAYLRAS